MVPGIGTIANGINAAWYAAEGDYASAALSATSMIPGVGTVIKGGTLAVKGAALATKVVPKAVAAAPKVAAAASKLASRASGAVLAGGKRVANAAKSASSSAKEVTQLVATTNTASANAASSLKGIGSAKAHVVKADVVSSANSGSGVRPHWRQSESDAKRLLLSDDYIKQESFKGKDVASYGEKGSVRPDWYNPKTNHSVEVKNYNLESSSGQSNLVSIAKKQYYQRLKHLPEGSRQTLVVDIRGQSISNEIKNSILSRIESVTGGGLEVVFM